MFKHSVMRYYLRLLILLLLTQSLAAKSFTDKQGNSIEGEIFAAYGPLVFIKLNKDQTIYFDVRTLIEEDYQYIVNWAKEYEPVRSNPPLVKDSTSKLTRFLEKNLVKVENGKLIKHNFSDQKEPEFYVFYSSASWCGPCRRFTPLLVAMYDQFKADGLNNFEVILISSDETNRDMLKYMETTNMRWPAVRFSRTESSLLEKFSGNGIPCLAVADRNGNVMFHSYRGGEYLGPKDPLDKLGIMLKLTQKIAQLHTEKSPAE